MFFDASFWLLISFLVFTLLSYRYLLPKISEHLEERISQIKVKIISAENHALESSIALEKLINESNQIKLDFEHKADSLREIAQKQIKDFEESVDLKIQREMRDYLKKFDAMRQAEVKNLYSSVMSRSVSLVKEYISQNQKDLASDFNFTLSFLESGDDISSPRE